MPGAPPPADVSGGQCVMAAGTSPALEQGKEALIMYSILYIIGAIVVIIVVLKLLGLY
jgi:hypothetical protein